MTTTVYRFLDVGDTVQQGDEYFNGTAWVRTRLSSGVVLLHGEACSEPVLYRRAVLIPLQRAVSEMSPIPVEGYRRLQETEVIEEGDEFFCHTSQVWRKTAFPGTKVEGGVYRRALMPEATTSVWGMWGKIDKLPPAIHWNPWNKVVQDHRDGEIYLSVTNLVRRELGLPVPWTSDLASKEVGEPPVFLTKGDKPL